MTVEQEKNLRRRNVGAAKVKERSGAAGNNTETRTWGAWVGILKGVPEGIDLAKELCTTNLIPVLLSILGVRCRLVGAGTADGPASFGNPDRLAPGSGFGLCISRVEKRLGNADVVGHCALEVWVGIKTDEVGRLNDGTDRTVDPGGPGINMTNRGVDTGARDSRFHLADVA